MKIKQIITALLFLFIGASVVFLIVDGRESQVAFKQESSTASSGVKNAELSKTVIVYYFHTTFRCYSCVRIESLTSKSIQQGFPEELRTGKLVWRPVNIDKPGNKKFIKEYNIISKSVIIADNKNNRQIKWKNLDRIWMLLKDEDNFIKYIQKEVEEYL